MKVLKQIAESGIFLPHLSKIHLRIEVDCAKHIAQLTTVSLLDVTKRHIDFLTDFRIIPVLIKVVERGVLIHSKPLPVHSSLHTAHISLVLFDIIFFLFLSHIAQILYKQHG